MRKIIALAGFAAIMLSGCGGYVSKYEEHVHDMEPVYCYRTIGGITCHGQPDHTREARLVNYFGPAPSRYEKPAPLPEPELYAPQDVGYYVMDPEPVPEPASTGQTVLPWSAQQQAAHGYGQGSVDDFVASMSHELAVPSESYQQP